MAKTLVTGSSGFIAGHLVKALLEQDDAVLGVDKKDGIDLTDKNLCLQVVENIDVIYHLASETNLEKSIEDPQTALGDDLLTTVNLLEACRKINPSVRFVFTSSAAVYGHLTSQKISEDEVEGNNIISPYGAHKRACEIYLSLYHCVHSISSACLRLFNVYGPGQMNLQAAIPSFTLSILREERIKIKGDGFQSRDFIHVSDVVQALLLMGNSNYTGIFNVGTGKAFTLLDLLLILVNLTGKKLYADHLPGLKWDIRHSCADISKMHGIGWGPDIELQEGLKDTVEFYKGWGEEAFPEFVSHALKKI